MLDLRSPLIFSIEITNKCNFYCPGCGNVFSKDGRLLSLDEWKMIIEKIRPYAKIIRLTGGEPTIHPDFFKILESLDSLGIPINIFTNGFWEDKTAFIGELKKISNFSGFLLSFHGLGADSFAKFSDKNFTVEKYDKIVENIKYAAQCGFDVHTSTVLGANNYMELEALSRFLLSLGVKSLVFERYIGKDTPNISLDDDRLKSAILTLERLKSAGFPITIGNCVPHCFSRSSSTGCSSGTGFGTIDPYGNMRPCAHSPKILGSLLTEEIENIWKGRDAKKWRRDIPVDCKLCGYSCMCAGGCHANAEIRGDKKDPLIKGRIPKTVFDKPIPVALSEELIPEIKAEIRREDGGYLLIHQNNFFMFINNSLIKIIDFIQGSGANLRQVEKKFGKKGLSLLYSLYTKGFIVFNKPPVKIERQANTTAEKVTT